MLSKHLAGLRQHFIPCDRVGKEAHSFTGVIASNFTSVAQHQNRQRGHSDTQFGHKCWTADPSHMHPGNDQAEIPGKLRLFHQTESIGCIAHPLHVSELPFQDRLPLKRLEGIAVHQ
jgi:hypothetical protein